jgi:phage terminase large subunit-like protein
MMVARDEAGFGKVDPVMALFNAAHLMSLNPIARGQSIFDHAAWWDTPAKPAVKESKNVAVHAKG